MSNIVHSQGIRLGGVELGGTSCNISFALDNALNVLHTINIPTQTPDITLQIISYILSQWSVDAIGIASFGPINMHVHEPTFGYITDTPKPHWKNVNVVGGIREYLYSTAYQRHTTSSSTTTTTKTTGSTGKDSIVDILASVNLTQTKIMSGIPPSPFSHFPPKDIPIGFNTDVNAAVLAELLYGQHTGNTHDIVYITVGTGIGGGMLVNKRMVGALSHPEMGHIPIAPHEEDVKQGFVGQCPYHKYCLEGYAANRALSMRVKKDITELASIPDTMVYGSTNIWEVQAYYLAQMCVSLLLTTSPQKIVLGGGIMQRTGLLEKVHAQTLTLLGGYLGYITKDNIASIVVKSNITSVTPGIAGSLCLAQDVLVTKNKL